MRFQVKEKLSDQEIESGLKAVVRDGLATQAMTTFSSGVFLVAFALQLGASNLMIGLLAAIPPLAQLIQIPSIFLVEKLQNRRIISVSATSVGRTFLLLIAAIPFLFSGRTAIAALVVALILHTAIGAVSLCAWNSWMRDLVPLERLGKFFSRRMSLSVGFSIVLSLLAAGYIDYWAKYAPHKSIYAYSVLFAGAFIAGLMGTYFISIIPEPRMIRQKNHHNILDLPFKPFKDLNFRKLMTFLGSWNFAVNLAAPFFTVYMLKRLKLDMSYVIGLTVLSQFVNVIFLRLWGRFSDRFSNKAALRISGPLFMVTILAWTFTTMPDRHGLTMPLLIVIHILMGVALAGVTLSSSNIALKLAPRGEATSYLAASSLVNSLSAGIAPILGGRFADYFAQREFAWTMNWKSPNGELVFKTLDFQGWDFFFVLAFLIGIYSIHRLVMVKEEGEVEGKIVAHEVLSFAMRPLRNFSTAGGLRNLISHPLSIIKHAKRNQNDS